MRLTIIFSLLILGTAGCASFQGHYYARNLTEYPAIIRAVVEDDITSEDLSSPAQGQTQVLPFTDGIINVNFESKNGFKKYTDVKPLDAARVEFIIPPRSTIFIGYGINQKFVSGFDQFIILVNGKETSLRTQNIFQMNLKKESRKKYIGCFDIN